VTHHKSKVDPIDRKFIQLVKRSIEDIADDDGWAFLAAVGALINKKKPDFDPRNYGFTKLTPLIKSLRDHFIVDVREVENSQNKHIFVRVKK
ncbi:MAG: Maebl, partial [Bacteroidales bacterium]|nr:Maebl [Bacteroidales bacterium]